MEALASSAWLSNWATARTYGWIELAIDPTTLTGTLIEGAYESVAGMQITTPQAVPEPSSLGLSLLALGSVGVGALLRSRKQAATAAA